MCTINKLPIRKKSGNLFNDPRTDIHKYIDYWRERKKERKKERKNIEIIISSSSYRAGSTDIPDPLSPLFPMVHRPS